MLGEGMGVAQTARRVGWSDRTVRKWRARWEEDPRVESLKDRPRSGRPTTISAETRCEVIKLACDEPDKLLVPFRDTWTQGALVEALRRQTGTRISRSSVQRILSAEGLKPHRMRPWLHSPDPDFRLKVARICALYRDRPKDTVVLCVDEKPLQALERRFATTRGHAGEVRRDFEYKRHGVGHLLAAYNTRTGEVTAQVVDSRDGTTLVKFMKKVARRYRGKRVVVIWDNLNIHFDGKAKRWSRFNARHGGSSSGSRSSSAASSAAARSSTAGGSASRSRPSRDTGTSSRRSPSAGPSTASSITRPFVRHDPHRP